MRFAKLLCCVPLLTMTGCALTNNTDKGMALGGLLGAGLGTAVGAATGHTGLGTVVGGLTGAAVGGMAGNSADRREERQFHQAVAQERARRQVSVPEVIQMTQQRLSDDLIINQINSTGSTYMLTTVDITDLRNQGVSDRVIMHMQNRHPRSSAVVVHPAPEVVVVEPAPRVIYRPVPPPPPAYVGIGVGF